MHQIYFALGLHPRRAYFATPDSLAGGQGTDYPSLRTLPLLSAFGPRFSALQASILCSPGYNDSSPGPRGSIINTIDGRNQKSGRRVYYGQIAMSDLQLFS